MDSVVVFFASATHEEVEREALKYGFADGVFTRDQEHFYFSRYSIESAQVELSVEEQAALKAALGTRFKAAFEVRCRHGADARLALQVVSPLMAQFRPSVLDDDHGNLWLPAQVAACAADLPLHGIYALRSGA